MVNRLVPLNARRASLFGWSLGGLFVVHTMFVHPESFHGYIALSPSIWRGNKAVLAELPDFEKRVSESKIDLNLFLGVGELEEKFLPSDGEMGATTKTSFARRSAMCAWSAMRRTLRIKLVPILSRTN